MDNEDEKLIHFASGRHYSTFKLKVANLNEDDMSKLRKELFDFSNFYNEYNFLNKLIKEPFYDTFLNKILMVDYSGNSELLLNSLTAFFEAMSSLCMSIIEITSEWDTPAGHLAIIDPEYCYNELVPKLKNIDGKFYLVHDFIYASVIKKLSQSLNDGGLLVKMAIYHNLPWSVRERFKSPIESLDKETIMELFKEEIEAASTSEEMSRAYSSLNSFISTDLLDDFHLKDMVFVFIDGEDAKIVQLLFDLKRHLRLVVYNPSTPNYSSEKWDVLYNQDKQVIGLCLRAIDLEGILPQIPNLKHLKILTLSNTKISKLPEKIGSLACLEVLNLDGGNIIQGLPKSMKNLKNLKKLNLSGNLLTEMKGIEGLANLQELILSGCQITEMNNLDRLVKLTHLDLSNNQICEIKNLDPLVNLTSLDLSHNRIIEIKDMDKLTNLKYLTFSGNKITDIKNLDPLVNLVHLDLGDNQITEIKGLEELTRLEELDLQRNQITKIKGLGTLEALGSVFLRENPVLEISELFKELNILLSKNRFNSFGFKRSSLFEYRDVRKLVRYCKYGSLYLP